MLTAEDRRRYTPRQQMIAFTGAMAIMAIINVALGETSVAIGFALLVALGAITTFSIRPHGAT